jgi:aminopeptidase N
MRFKVIFLVGFLLFLGDSTVFGKINPNRERTIDVQDYSISVDFDRNRKAVFGDTTVTFKSLKKGLSELKLDSVGIRYSNISSSSTGEILTFRTTASSILVRLPKSLEIGEEMAVRFQYTAQPSKGVYFVDPGTFQWGGVQRSHSSQIWTQGQPEEARHWIPSYDFPDDKATTSMTIRTGSNETAISNGRHIGTSVNIDGTLTHRFRMDQPYSTYLISFVIGEYKRTDFFHGDLPLSVYRYPSAPEIGESVFLKTIDMLRIFEELFGIRYPFNKYDQVVVARFVAGGMENITATTLSDSSINRAVTPMGEFAAEDLIAHEVAHAWFGNLVTSRNWAELWLNEGFATFLEAAYREKMYGTRQYRMKIDIDAAEYLLAEKRMRNKRGLYNARAKGDDSIFDQVTYQKGGVVIHMLRRTVGEDAFWKSLNIYLNRHRLANVESSDLQKVFEEVSGRDLKWFFDQWVYASGYPRIRLEDTVDRRTGNLTLNFSQLRSNNRLQPQVFRLRFIIRTLNDDGTSEDHEVYLRRRSETVTIRIKPDFKKFEVDPDGDVPLMEFTKR